MQKHLAQKTINKQNQERRSQVKFKKRFLIAAVICWAICASVLVFEIWASPPLTFTAKSLDTVTFRWESKASFVIDHFEAKLIRENSDVVYSYNTKETTINVKSPKPGIYWFQFRTCKDKDCLIASSWCNSIDPACVDGGQIYKLQFQPMEPFLQILRGAL